MLLRPVMSAVVAHCILPQHACHHLRRRHIAGTDRMIRPGKDNFMTKRILIDARQTEETRVVLLSGTRIDDFDYETENRKQLKGNVYLARVTRVEPSLQPAFVEYGGNRQGFLAFSEIHPDYYRIPVEDREALIEAETAVGDDDLLEGELRCSFFEHLPFDGLSGGEAVDVHGLGLTDSVHAIHRL